MAEISGLDREQLQAIEGIGPEIARSVVLGFRSERVKMTLDLMEEAGVNLETIIEEKGGRKAMADQNGTLEGKAFVVTGKLEGMTRQDAES